MPMMTLMLLASVLPFRFPLLNLCMRDSNNALCEPFETLKRRFGCFHFRLWHVARVRHHSGNARNESQYPPASAPGIRDSRCSESSCAFKRCSRKETAA